MFVDNAKSFAKKHRKYHIIQLTFLRLFCLFDFKSFYSDDSSGTIRFGHFEG